MAEIFEVVGSAGFVILYLMVISSVWFLPQIIGFEGLSFFNKIMISVFTLPIIYFIVARMAEQ